MTRHFILAVGLMMSMLFFACQKDQTAYLEKDYPKKILQRGELKLVYFKPDSSDGYYRGSRFDWGNMIGQIYYKGHTFYAESQVPHKPENPDHAIGSVLEFSPIISGNDSATDTILKIGTGILTGPKKNTLKPLAWTIASVQTWMTVESTLL